MGLQTYARLFIVNPDATGGYHDERIATPSRDPMVLTLPAGCFGVRFYDQDDRGMTSNYSGLFYLDLDAMPVDDAIARDDPHRHQLETYKATGIEKVIQAPTGRWLPLASDDKVLERRV